jgi:acetyl-CoA carboxylase biotin carboxyl carrier protein
METKDILDLLRFLSKSDFTEVTIETSDWKLSVKRGGEMPVVVAPSLPAAAPAVGYAAVPSAPALPTTLPPSQAAEPPKTPPAEAPKKSTTYIRSPMVGTFYRAPSPDKPPYVQIGDTVQKGQVVCIIEAMKLFNEIQSEISGRIVRILVENAQPVEYDQPLFEVEPIE